VSIPVMCECGRHFESPAANAGRPTRCPECGRELTVPKPKPPVELDDIPWGPVPAVTSGKAIASFVLGVLFIFACLSGVPAILLGRQALSDIDRSGGRLKGRRMAVAGIVLGLVGCLFTLALLMPAVRSAGEAARRAECVNNLKQIGLAVHNYYDANGSLPPAAITDKNGRPLLSWRVTILPYLESSTLYSKFHLDEPWHSPHNLSLLDPMPSSYACPSDKTLKPGTTGYQVVVGPGTAFTPDFKPLRFEDFADGHHNTFLVGESRRHVPWTKPEDLPFDMTVPLTGLGSHHGYHDNGFNALFGDGAVRFIKRSITPPSLDAFLSRSGNRRDDLDGY
jgi:prepilin-type processing-associated H-X9-DG protein